VITDATIWDKLTSHGIVTCEREPSQEVYSIVVQYLTEKMLHDIVSGNPPYQLADYDPMYMEAAEREITERNLLGKKRLEVPV
jgi:hypothetical protein